MPQKVSVIVTVLNEEGSIGTLLASLGDQTRPPDEVVIVDGGSTDGTLASVRAFAERAPFPVTALSSPGANISQGRNQAVAAASGPIIASTDAGVRLEPDWLEKLVAPFGSEARVDVVSGFFVADPRSLFERALGAVTLPRVEEVNPARFHPSSRAVAYRKEAWQAVGGYPEWLDYCEDLVFDFALRDAGCAFTFAPSALVHFRPRATFQAFLRQYFRYARGDGKADLWRYRHLVRYVTYLCAGPAILALAVWHHPLWWVALTFTAVAMLRGTWRRVRPELASLSVRERLTVLGWAPVIRVGGDLAKMVGYPVGVLWRWRHAPQEPWAERQW